MTCIKDGQEVGMPADMNLKSGAKIKTDGTLTDAKGKTVSLKEGDAIPIFAAVEEAEEKSEKTAKTLEKVAEKQAKKEEKVAKKEKKGKE